MDAAGYLNVASVLEFCWNQVCSCLMMVRNSLIVI